MAINLSAKVYGARVFKPADPLWERFPAAKCFGADKRGPEGREGKNLPYVAILSGTTSEEFPKATAIGDETGITVYLAKPDQKIVGKNEKGYTPCAYLTLARGELTRRGVRDTMAALKDPLDVNELLAAGYESHNGAPGAKASKKRTRKPKIVVETPAEETTPAQ